MAVPSSGPLPSDPVPPKSSPVAPPPVNSPSLDDTQETDARKISSSNHDNVSVRAPLPDHDQKQDSQEAALESGTHDHATAPVVPRSSTPVNADTGLVPTSQPSDVQPQPQPDTTTASGSAEGTADKEKDEEKRENGSSSPTLTGTKLQARASPTKANNPTTPEGALSSSNAHSAAGNLNGHSKPKAPGTDQPRKPTFLSKLVWRLVPCVAPSSRAHPLEIEKPVVPPAEHDEKPKESPREETPAAPPKDAPSAPEVPTVDDTPLPLTPAHVETTPTALPDADVIPPTAPHLLPESETEGVTSGAVQAPGSTGGSSIHNESRDRAHSRDSVAGGDGEESEGTSFTEEEDLDDANNLDEADEEDRLIMNGGAGIPIGPDGTPRPLLPPIAPQHAGRKCLVLDLDETLVHSSFKSIQQADYVVPVEIEYQWHNVYVIKRPGVDNFLKKMGEIYEVVVFTASLSKYADPVLDKLDIHQVVSHRLFRESCYNHKGNYVKDLSQLGRPIADTIILDNSPASYIFHPNNAVPVSSWFNDPHDTELTDLVPFLTDLATVDDVRGVLDGAR